jgi:hypothetical protein
VAADAPGAVRRVRFLTPAEQRLLDNARPSERVIVRDLFELLDARLVTDGGGDARTRTPHREELPPSVTSLSLFDQEAA